MTSSLLSPAQAHALFDILTHHEIYAEIENFKWPNAIHSYGPPFITQENVEFTSPMLQQLLTKFILPLPGLRDVAPDFWTVRVQSLIEKLGDAELSESYDKGAIGSRKTLATAISTILEYPARGVLGAYFKRNSLHVDRTYDINKAEDLLQSFEDFSQALVYGDMIDELFGKVAETDQLSEHSPLVRSAHEYVVIFMASLMHHILILSPDGQYLVKIIDNVHKLVPYVLIRQTLRVGNAATMINGMIRLMLAKLSVNTITNWIGLSKEADEGMNLLQQIISTVLSWDSSEYQKKATKIEKDKDGPSKEHLEAIRQYVKKPREEHEKCRQISIEKSKSIVTVIFETTAVISTLTELQHAQALEYLQLLLSIRDREELIKILCRSQPDLLTQAIRDLVTAYDPIIRSVHNAVDLSATVTDLENFLNDFIKISKPSKKSGSVSPCPPPTVEDYFHLLKRHQLSVHRFLHQFVKNEPDISGLFCDYAHSAMGQFRSPHSLPSDESTTSPEQNGRHGVNSAGVMTTTLNDLVSKLSGNDQANVLAALDNHAAYLEKLSISSATRMKAVLRKDSKVEHGPGMFLARWRTLLEATQITPVTPQGPLRNGYNNVGLGVSKLAADGEAKAESMSGNRFKGKTESPKAPDVSVVVRLLREDFRKVLCDHNAIQEGTRKKAD